MDEEELPKKDQDRFFKIFRIDGGHENRNFQTWRRMAYAFELKEVPKSVEAIKEKVNRIITDMDWKDIEEINKVYTLKLKKKKVDRTEESTEVEGRIGADVTIPGEEES